MLNSPLPRLFLHGWGQAPPIWLQTSIAMRDDDILLALPGHGGAEDLPPAAWLDGLIAQLPKHPVHLVGWSLGAMLALQLAAQLPQQVSSLTLYAATPCFCCRAGWSHGVTPEQLDAIASSVRGTAMEQGLTRFTRMMLHGEGYNRTELRQITTQQLTNMMLPTHRGLEAGIALLRTLDLRTMITNIQQPVQLIHGRTDTIVPISAGEWLFHHLPHAQHQWLSDYGHMPWGKNRKSGMTSST